MEKEFFGYHSEWNLGSPGGWDYQRMAQEIAKFSWHKINEEIDIDVELDFDDPILNPIPPFSDLLMRFHKRNFGKEKPFIALVAEEETLDKVGENIRFVEHLNSLPDVKACLIAPHQLELKNEKVYVRDERVSVVFVDFNNNVTVRLRKKYNLEALITAIKQGIVINPRGMEPIGSKGVFEAVTLDYKGQLSESTFKRTPWTRLFYPRQTSGPNGEKIGNLVNWAKANWDNIILKPVHGYSGKGILIGQKEKNINGAVKAALAAGDYIIQQFIPPERWAEEFPWVDKEGGRVFIKRWQTDFRVFITDQGLMGFVTRFGGIPTNVGCGGGVQSAAILRSKMTVSDAVKRVNESIAGLNADFLMSLQERIDNMSVQMGNVYLLGPIMSTLRPRIIAPRHLDQLKRYAGNLWADAVTLENLWLEGKLTRHVKITEEEEEIAHYAPWRGKPAIVASDGLFNFTDNL